MSEIKISSIQIFPIKIQDGLCGFANCVIDDRFYLGDLAIYTSPSSPKGFRICWPKKKLSSGKYIDFFHPITQEAGKAITDAIINKYLELMDQFVSNDQSLVAAFNSLTKSSKLTGEALKDFSSKESASAIEFKSLMGEKS